MNSGATPIGIVGAGAVARALGRSLIEAGVPVMALAGRRADRAREAAAVIGSTVQVVSCQALARLTDRVIIAVTDEGIGQVARTLAEAMTGVALHTSGATGLAPCEPLRAAGVACGVLHPLQSVVAEQQDTNPFNGVTFGVTGDPEAVEWAGSIAASVNGHVLLLDEASLPSYHAGAAMASNAPTAALDAAVVLLAQAGIEPDAALRAVGPLCRTSVENALRLGPQAALTGPVARGDATTVAAHLASVARAPESVAGLYRAAARHMLALARARGLSPAAVRSLTQILEGPELESHDVRKTSSDH